MASSTGRSAAVTESETFTQQGVREARAELARALAAFAGPERTFGQPGDGELARGSALLRTRVLRGAFSAAREASRAQASELSDGLAGLVRSGRYAYYSKAPPAMPTPADAPWRPFVLLSRTDRTLLSVLYASARSEGHDLHAVDDVARALLVLRQREQATRAPEAEAQSSAATRLALPAPIVPRELTSHSSLAPSADSSSEIDASSESSDLARSESYAPRSYGSVTQLAARASSSYRSLLPPAGHGSSTSLLPVAAPEQALAAQEHAPSLRPEAVAGARPFNVAEALGLGSLVSSLNGKSQVARRKLHKRKRRAGQRPDARVDDREVERDAPPRPRWYELSRQRRLLRRATSATR
ncbi:MAG: hypothetical protein JWN48_1829 [Myxococcaceae bacterium]|nr:hypothetical protein [Myxococcaceae bacterium]